MRTPLITSLTLLALVAGCSNDLVADNLPGEALADVEVLAGERLAPPPAPTLTLADRPVLLGVSNSFTVSGLVPGQQARLLARNAAGAGPTCFGAPQMCVNLQGPYSSIRALATATANASGVATLTFVAPAAAPPGTTRLQVLGNPGASYALSNVLTARFYSPTADQDGDGLTNSAEIGLGTNPDVADTDGGGVSDGVEVNTWGTDPLNGADDPIDNDGDGYPSTSDCDDANASVNPGAHEVCGGVDEDCDGLVDGPDAWFDAAWPYRVQVTVTAPATRDTTATPVALNVNFRAALDALGDGSALDLNSVRVIRQDCALGQPEMPSEFIDGLKDIFAKASIDDTLGDEAGTVVFEVDQDGDYTTDEIFPAGSTATFAVYFGSADHSPGAPAPAYPSSLAASTDGTTTELSNTLTFSSYKRIDNSNNPIGGMADNISPQGSSNVGKMSSTGLGNGIYVNTPGGGPSGVWLTARGDANASLTVVHEGPVFAAVRSTGTRATSPTYPVQAGFNYEYTYFLFDGRPEVYVKPYIVINTANTNVGPQGTAWTAAVRPFIVDNLSLVGGTGSEGSRALPQFDWVRGTYNTGGAIPYGLAAGFRTSVAQRGSPVWQADGRWVGLVGQDREVNPTTAEKLLQIGDVVVDRPVIAAYPHTGLFGSVSVDFYGILQGATPAASAPEAW